jgi:hypothetical protein
MVARYPESPAWDALAEVWEDMLKGADAKLAPYRAGLAMPRFERLAGRVPQRGVGALFLGGLCRGVRQPRLAG